MNAIGLEGEGIKEIIEAARIEDRNHFEALVPRIYELGGELPRDIRAFADQAGCPDAYLPDSLHRGTGSIADLPGSGHTSMGDYPPVAPVPASTPAPNASVRPRGVPVARGGLGRGPPPGRNQFGGAVVDTFSNRRGPQSATLLAIASS